MNDPTYQLLIALIDALGYEAVIVTKYYDRITGEEIHPTPSYNNIINIDPTLVRSELKFKLVKKENP